MALKARARVVHIPGLDGKDFARFVLATDFQAVDKRSRELKDLLEGARTLEILTTDPSGATHRLHVSIKGRRPYVSGGAPAPGEMFTLPCGETYVAPLEGTGEGTIILNGSANLAVFRASTPPVLSFRAGRLVLSECGFPEEERSLRVLNELLRSEAADPDALQLAEIGIGTNYAITQLTGENVIDEKAGGTAHIAVGSNTAFGGRLRAMFHLDMVFFPVAVLVDGKALPHEWAVPWQREGG